MVRAGIVGASGYAGGELMRLLVTHPGVRVTRLASRSHAGKAAYELYPGLRGYDLPAFSDASPAELARECDVVFISAPSGAAIPVVRDVLDASGSARIIDIGSDFRLKDASAYAEWYGMVHEAPELLAESVYGLTELHRAEVRNARIVANPGCYPTAALLALAPLVAHGIIDVRSVVINATSGVSGAGRTPSLGYHFPECDENVRPYSVPRHRHIPEIEQELGRLSARASDGGDDPGAVVSFTPHLVPSSRGILLTAHASLLPGVGSQPGRPADVIDAAALTRLYGDFYAGERFVRVLGDDLPQTKAVQGSNFCDIAVRVDSRAGRVVALAALDNLVKGAAGQAIQNMNVMFGEDEAAGIAAAPLWP